MGAWDMRKAVLVILIMLYVVLPVLCSADGIHGSDYNKLPVVEFTLENGDIILSDENIVSAELKNYTDEVGNMQYCVMVVFDEAGTEILAQSTGEHIGELMHIIVNGEEVSAPRIHQAITGGECVISGITLEEAEELVTLLTNKPDDYTMEELIQRVLDLENRVSVLEQQLLGKA